MRTRQFGNSGVQHFVADALELQVGTGDGIQQDFAGGAVICMLFEEEGQIHQVRAPLGEDCAQLLSRACRRLQRTVLGLEAEHLFDPELPERKPRFTLARLDEPRLLLFALLARQRR